MNINEIAALAGVSRATVSRYLNNGYVSAEKKEQIRKVIEETGYQPSAQAQMLRTKKTGSIGVILPKINSDSVSRMVHGISSILREKGYQLLLADTQNDIKEEIRCLKQLGQNHVDGIILIGSIITKEHYRVMKDINIPLVVLAQCVKEYSCVYYDDYGAAKELTKRALEHGNNPAFIGALIENESVGQERLYGFLDANFELDRAIKEGYCTNDMISIEQGYESAKSLLQMDSEIDTLICATDILAMGAMRYLKECGKKIPEDVQIAGFGDDLVAKVCDPPLTSVHFYYKTSGEEAAKMLIDMMEESPSVRKEMKIGYQIMETGTLRR
ncbi:MAG: LacI family DNA-binding transcriptional regulator [Lachnospiraceae bacterium]